MTPAAKNFNWFSSHNSPTSLVVTKSLYSDWLDDGTLRFQDVPVGFIFVCSISLLFDALNVDSPTSNMFTWVTTGCSPCSILSTNQSELSGFGSYSGAAFSTASFIVTGTGSGPVTIAVRQLQNGILWANRCTLVASCIPRT